MKDAATSIKHYMGNALYSKFLVHTHIQIIILFLLLMCIHVTLVLSMMISLSSPLSICHFCSFERVCVCVCVHVCYQKHPDALYHDIHDRVLVMLKAKLAGDDLEVCV